MIDLELMRWTINPCQRAVGSTTYRATDWSHFTLTRTFSGPCPGLDVPNLLDEAVTGSNDCIVKIDSSTDVRRKPFDAVADLEHLLGFTDVNLPMLLGSIEVVYSLMTDGHQWKIDIWTNALAPGVYDDPVLSLRRDDRGSYSQYKVFV